MTLNYYPFTQQMYKLQHIFVPYKHGTLVRKAGILSKLFWYQYSRVLTQSCPTHSPFIQCNRNIKYVMFNSLGLPRIFTDATQLPVPRGDFSRKAHCASECSPVYIAERRKKWHKSSLGTVFTISMLLRIKWAVWSVNTALFFPNWGVVLIDRAYSYLWNPTCQHIDTGLSPPLRIPRVASRGVWAIRTSALNTMSTSRLALRHDSAIPIP